MSDPMTEDAAFHAAITTLGLDGLPLGAEEPTMRQLFSMGAAWGATRGAEGKPVWPQSNEAIYATYPRKVGRQAALKAIAKAVKAAGYDKVMEATIAYASATHNWPPEERQYIPHPATWYNRGSYEDDPKEWQRGAAATAQFSRYTVHA